MKIKIKSLIMMVLAVNLMLILSTCAFASENSTIPSHQKYSTNTVITEDNMNDILKYLGLDPNKVIKTNRSVNRTVTVGELQKAIAESKNLPKIINEQDSIPTNVKPSGASTIVPLTSGTKTVGTSTQYTSSLIVDYYATGAFSGGYWTAAYGSSFAVEPTNNPLNWWVVTKTYNNTNNLYNGGTSSAYLHFSYNFDLTNYYGLGGYGIPINAININGFKNFDNSYL